MDKKWSLSEEIYRAFHRWPSLAGVILAGCLAGWLISYLMPPYYRAISYIYVALNPYRTYSDTNFLALARPRYSNIDDYKDWQMTQLESVIYLDQFILETKSRLDELDPDWQAFSVDQLREILEADWRSAGTWSLIANSADAGHAEQAASVWAEVVVEGVDAAVESARQTFMIDQELQAKAELLQELALRKEELETASANLDNLSGEAGLLATDQPLNTRLRLQILSQVTRMAEFSPIWMDLLDKQPGEPDTPGTYSEWIEQAQVVMDQEILATQLHIQELEQSKSSLSTLYREKADASLGLSPNLEIEALQKGIPERIRPTATLIILGGTTAFLLWVLFQLIIITRKTVYE